MVERYGPYVDSMVRTEAASNIGRILEEIFAICGYSKEEYVELNKSGRLEAQHHVCEIAPCVDTYIIILDKETMFTVTFYLEYDFKANSATCKYGYEIYKRRSDYD